MKISGYFVRRKYLAFTHMNVFLVKSKSSKSMLEFYGSVNIQQFYSDKVLLFPVSSFNKIIF